MDPTYTTAVGMGWGSKPNGPHAKRITLNCNKIGRDIGFRTFRQERNTNTSMTTSTNHKLIVAVTVRGSSYANNPNNIPDRLIKAPVTRAATLGFRTHRVCHTYNP